MSISKLFIAGSGGQGILLMGQMIAKAAMVEDKEITFLPSYGPEMRGGTANCTVVVSDKSISCPLIYEADVLVAMNTPSQDRFESMLKPGGKLFANASLITTLPKRTDIEVFRVDADALAMELGNRRTANVIMLGAIIGNTDIVSRASMEKVLEKTFSGKKASLLEINLKALDIFKR